MRARVCVGSLYVGVLCGCVCVCVYLCGYARVSNVCDTKYAYAVILSSRQAGKTNKQLLATYFLELDTCG